jgi:peroxiredoxin
MPSTFHPAPSLNVSQWFNAPEPLTLDALRGRIIVLHAFQMLCPGCVSHGVPQAQAVHERFSEQGIVVIGLHTVFEHHEAMPPVALAAFIHEYRLSFPIGVDRPSAAHGVPLTMQAYQLRGTPSLVVIDQVGRIRLSAFGRVDDLGLGTLLGQLLADAPAFGAGRDQPLNSDIRQGTCDDHGCGHP